MGHVIGNAEWSHLVKIFTRKNHSALSLFVDGSCHLIVYTVQLDAVNLEGEPYILCRLDSSVVVVWLWMSCSLGTAQACKVNWAVRSNKILGQNKMCGSLEPEANWKTVSGTTVVRFGWTVVEFVNQCSDPRICFQTACHACKFLQCFMVHEHWTLNAEVNIVAPTHSQEEVRRSWVLTNLFKQTHAPSHV